MFDRPLAAAVLETNPPGRGPARGHRRVRDGHDPNRSVFPRRRCAGARR